MLSFAFSQDDDDDDNKKENSMEFSFEWFYLLLSFLLLICLSQLLKPANRRLPPGPVSLPVIGSAHKMLSSRPAHRTLRDLSAVYGPIMHLRLGEIPTIIISSAEAAREIFKTHDLNFASRSISVSIQIVTKGVQDLTFAPYGSFWRQMRRICVLSLLSPKRTRSFAAIRAEEVLALLQSVEASCASSPAAAVNLSEKVSYLANNITVRAAIGDGSKIDQKLFLWALSEVKKEMSGFSLADLFPSAPFLATLTGFRRKLERCHGKVDQMLDVILEEHREKRASNRAGEESDGDLMDVLLRFQRDDSLQFPISDDNIKCLLNDLFAGTETSASTVEWAMSELIRCPEAMRKAQREVREVLGKDYAGMKMMQKEERVSTQLSYTKLVIRETLRLHPPVPLLLPQECAETCTVMGHEIPKKARVMVNAWAIGRDAKYWEEPEAFRPERFEESARDFYGADFEFLPFGAGRRVCPGIQFGMVLMELALASLLYYFDWEYPAAKDSEELDMREVFGVAAGRKLPLCLRPTQRFPLPQE